jgi:CRP-like cAMP-binding protein
MSYESVFQKSSAQKEIGGYPALNLPQMLTDLSNDDPVFHHQMNMHIFKRGEILADAESLQSQMFVLMKGRVHLVCTNNEGRRLVIATLEAGAVFGEGALTNPGEPNVFAEAAEDVTAWSIPAAEARDMTIQYPILGWGMLQTYGRRLQQVENSLEDVAYKKLPERLAALLVDLGEQYDGAIQGVSHQALADRLGTYRETVSAILRDFKRQALVTLGYRRIEIIDSETLKEIAGIWDW